MMHDDILTAARDIVRDEGFKELSMRTLARAVGVTAPTLYDYFPSKEAVLNGLYTVGVRSLAEQFERIRLETASGLDAIAAMARAYREFALTQQDLFLIVFGRVDATYSPGEAELRECKGLMDQVTSAMRVAIEKGEMVQCDPEVAAYFLWTTVHGAVMLELNKVVGKWDRETLRAMFEQNLAMLRLAFSPRHGLVERDVR
jgi:AcrR family transcriptional regulator